MPQPPTTTQHPASTKIHRNSRGYEAVYDPALDICHVEVRGFKTPDGRIVERGWPSNPDDKVVAQFEIRPLSLDGWHPKPPTAPTRDTFHDAASDVRDLLGAPIFRRQPCDGRERSLFAAAFDAAQKVRKAAHVFDSDVLVFSCKPSLFALADCFARDVSGAFWLMWCAHDAPGASASRNLSVAAYILEAGGYVPANAAVRLGVWTLAPSGSRFAEVPNDRIAARDVVIESILSVPF